MANNSQAKDVYFIEGGTGIQGGSVIEQLLLLKPAPVIRTISRDLSSPAVKKLQEQGVEVIQGGQGDKEALKQGVTGATFAFSVQNVIFTAEGIDGKREALDAQLLAEACKESGTVKFIVHTSVQSTAKYEEFKDFAVKYHMTAYWDGKRGAEEAIRTSGLPYAIVRPGFFASNFLASKAAYMQPALTSAEYLTIETRLSQIVPDDIGKFAVAAFQNPGKFNGREVDYVSQHLSPEEIAEALEAATGKKIKITRFNQEEAEAHPQPGWKMPQFMNELRKKSIVDTEALKREYPEIHFTTLKEYLIKHKAELAVGTAQ